MAANSNRIRGALLASTSLIAGVGGMLFVAPSALAQAILPTHGVVASGAASIRQSGAAMSVTQTSQRAVINWNSFSIGPGSGVTFDQPSSSSAILNRVTGSARSSLAGSLRANGQVYLVNPNGIAITPTGSVRVGGGFVASTLGISDSDFMRGILRFSGSGASAGVDNAGSIEAGPGGFVGLIGGTVSNSGVVTVPLGKVGMGSGEQATLNLTGDDFLQVAVPTNTKTADGRALVDVSGKVTAAGGSVRLKAATVARAIRDAVNIPGALSVSSASARGGSIILSGGPGGDVSVSGRLAAAGRQKGGRIAIDGHDVALRHAKIVASGRAGKGGSITVTGTNAVSLASASVDASGSIGGGAIRIGGDFHGASDVASARSTTIDSASTLNANATGSGDGGTIAVWSQAATSFAGAITAAGGPNGGNGGYAEVSADPATRGVLTFSGTADLTAPRGTTGTLLLDPTDLVFPGPLLLDANLVAIADNSVTFQGAVDTGFSTTCAGGCDLTVNTSTISFGGPLGFGLAGGTALGAVSLTSANDIDLPGIIARSLTADSKGGRILLGNFIGITNDVAFTAAGDIIETSFGGLSAAALTADSANGRVVMTAVSEGPNNAVGSASGAAPLGFSFVDRLSLTTAGISAAHGSIFLQAAGDITQTGPIVGAGLLVDAFGNVVLNGPGNSVETLAGGAFGTFQFANTGGAGLTIGPVSYLVSTNTDAPGTSTGSGITLFAPSTLAAAALAAPAAALAAPAPEIQVSTEGDLVLDSPVLGSNPNGLIVLSATGSFINNYGPGAVVDPWQIYSATPVGDVFNGLDSGNTAVWNTALGEALPATATGNRYVFAFQPAITVTAGNLAKLYWQDVTALVAADYTISGVQPGVPGAFLGDAAAQVYSGVPSVFSAGSPAFAPAALYPIFVGPGSLVIGDGYRFVANNGLLTVLPPPSDPGFLPGLTEINNPGEGAGGSGGIDQVLPRFTVNCNEPPSLPDPDQFRDPDAALRAISHAVDSYFKRCQNPTQETIANALDAFAAKLQVLAPRLPPALRNVPEVIAEGARRVRAARSRSEAAAVLHQTVAAVHKEIALVLSEDPQTRSREVRDGAAIEGALGAVTVALVNSGGL